MIQDISPKIFDNTYKNIQPKENDYIIFIGFSCIIAKSINNTIEFPTYKDTKNMDIDYSYLFSISEHHFFLAQGTNCEIEMQHDDFREVKISYFSQIVPSWKFFAAETAYQIGSWYKRNIFCGACGNKMIQSQNEHSVHCSVCGNILYPQICPAVIVGVINNDKLLVTHYKGSKSSRYSLIAGYAEFGETIEQTIAREVKEETGIQIKNIRYYKSQPWSFTSTLLFGFFCDLNGEDTITVDNIELSQAYWKTREELPNSSDDISLTSEMIQFFKLNKNI